MWTFIRTLFVASLTAIIAASLILVLRGQAVAQEHRVHPAADLPLHEKFYSTWFMPDEPTKSCCNKADCYPTEAVFKDGQWFARRRDDGKYIPVPWQKVERNRDSPDGRNHVCMPPPTATSYPPNTVFC